MEEPAPWKASGPFETFATRVQWNGAFTEDKKSLLFDHKLKLIALPFNIKVQWISDTQFNG